MNKRKSGAAIGPRKEPKQDRSRQTYQVILNGAMTLIRREGLKKLSTNRVAQESGVSIGSLYQYFPSKAAIVAAVIDQVLDHEFIEVKRVVEEIDPKEGARKVAKVFYSQYYRLPNEEVALRRSLIEAVPTVERSGATLKFHGSVGDMFLNYLRAHFTLPSDISAESFILQYLLKGITLSSVDINIDKMPREKLAEELAEMTLDLFKIPENERESRS